jgi:hypothetical protein
MPLSDFTDGSDSKSLKKSPASVRSRLRFTRRGVTRYPAPPSTESSWASRSRRSTPSVHPGGSLAGKESSRSRSILRSVSSSRASRRVRSSDPLSLGVLPLIPAHSRTPNLPQCLRLCRTRTDPPHSQTPALFARNIVMGYAFDRITVLFESRRVHRVTFAGRINPLV